MKTLRRRPQAVGASRNDFLTSLQPQEQLIPAANCFQLFTARATATATAIKRHKEHLHFGGALSRFHCPPVCAHWQLFRPEIATYVYITHAYIVYLHMGIIPNIWTVQSGVLVKGGGGIYGLATLQLAHKRIKGEMPKMQNRFAVAPPPSPLLLRSLAHNCNNSNS